MKTKWEISNPKYESDEINHMLDVSPWCGHRNFIYDLLNFLEPEKTIELGTHYGCSFFAMCQSVKDNSLPCELTAVDTWKGDEQAGFYDESVWDMVNQTINEYFKDINLHLQKMLFDDAAEKYPPETFDMIHIDGLHTYDAVKHDFEIWLPKLKPNGIMLFHDIHSHLGYGTNQFWKEIQANPDYKYFEFSHSWGLGVLFPKGATVLNILQEQNIDDKVRYYQYKAMYELDHHKTLDLSAMASERYEAIQQQSAMIAERDATIKSQAQMLDERYDAIQKQSAMIDERDAAIKSQAQMLDERYDAIQKQSAMIDERDATIKSQAQMLDERYDAIQKQSAMIAERDATIEQLKPHYM